MARRADGGPGARASFRDAGGRESTADLALVRAEQLVAGRPWRVFRWRQGQAHYSGWYWSATAGGHVVYESRLELARLLLADFDPQVTAIAAQPFLARGASWRAGAPACAGFPAGRRAMAAVRW